MGKLGCRGHRFYTFLTMYSGLQQTIYDYLQRQPLFRERKNKDQGIVNVLIDKYPILATIPKRVLVDVVRDYNSADRYWRLLLDDNHHPELRGKDYDTKQIVEQTKEIELGYETDYDRNLKKFNNL